MVLCAQHNRHGPFRQARENCIGPGQSMGMGDDAANIVKRNAARFRPFFRNRQKSAVDGDVKSVRGNIDYALHDGEITRLACRRRNDIQIWLTSIMASAGQDRKLRLSRRCGPAVLLLSRGSTRSDRHI